MYNRVLFLLILTLSLVSGWQLLSVQATSSALEGGEAMVRVSESILQPSDSTSVGSFGQSVSLSGDWALVGAAEDSKGSSGLGAGYLYHWDGDMWQESAKLEASDGSAGDGFGRVVSISGDVALVGAPFDDDHGTSSGAAYLFRFDGSQWQEEAKLTATDGAQFDRFGLVVSISGDVALVGAPFDGAGRAYIFRFDGESWQEERVLSNQGGLFGRSVSVNGNVALIGTNSSAIVYRFEGSTWQEEQVLAIGDGLASSLSVFGKQAIVGATSEGAAGKAYLFALDGSNWQEQGVLTSPNEEESFAHTVSLFESRALIGVREADNSTRSAYLYRFDGTNWVQETLLNASNGVSDHDFGHVVALADNKALIGAPKDNPADEQSGRAYLYDLSSLRSELFLPLLVNGQASTLPTPTTPLIQDHRLGIVQAYDAPEVATAVGAGWTRVYFSWANLQPNGAGSEFNPYYFPSEVMKRELEANRELVGVLIQTPAWASESGEHREVPSGLYLPYDDENNLWGQFVKQIVEEYQGQIDDWIIWNEPDVCHNKQGRQSWLGTPEDYAQLLKVGYQAAKSVNPDANIAIAATTYWWDIQICNRDQPYLTSVLDAIQQDPDAAANNGFFDKVAMNLYYDPDQIYNIITFYRQQWEERGFSNKELWLTETNSPPTTDPQHPRPSLCLKGEERCFDVTLEEQGYFLIQGWAMAMAAGAERLEYYKIIDGENPPPDGPFGITRQDGSLRLPIYSSFQTAVTYFGSFQNATYTPDGDVRRVIISRGERGTTTVLWNMGVQTQTVTIDATANSARLVQPSGEYTTITPSDGQYTINLQAKEEEWDQMGGKPLLLVEEAAPTQEREKKR
ncbi:MAG: hypothetical protein ACPGWR_27625 [Ardenticatenaceae bacterium]